MGGERINTFSPPWSCEWRSDIRNLSPIEGDEAHSQAMNSTEQLTDSWAVWLNPNDPAEVTESGEEIPRNKVWRKRYSDKFIGGK